jgi:hypothetical protein
MEIDDTAIGPGRRPLGAVIAAKAAQFHAACFPQPIVRSPRGAAFS